jgi:hypothetical protein
MLVAALNVSRINDPYFTTFRALRRRHFHHAKSEIGRGFPKRSSGCFLVRFKEI